MTAHDVCDVLAIDRRSFTPAWNVRQLRRCLAHPDIVGTVATVNDKIVGYQIHELHPNSVEITRLAVDAEHRRQSIGTSLIATAKGELPPASDVVGTIVLEANVDAQLFLKKCGFRAVRAIRGYCLATGKDAYCMVYRVGYRRVLPNISLTTTAGQSSSGIK